MDKPQIDLNSIFEHIDNMEESEIDSILNIANFVYDFIDVPVVVVNNKEIKANILMIAMFLAGKEVGRAEA